ncbi:hypothetical protein [Massilia sp. H6]|uniref:hypothetical protein n=1 Tax=Massilia sp. H6 TaxID=2970464 RepID=UPI002168E383|nr:hypothetical protein [Massilia sp. H6]UVW29196.1 hypothetical protein NRS07_03345 [Massilia sp. H6]
MAFENTDRLALERARKRGFTYTIVDTSSYDWHEYVFRIYIGPHVAQGFDAGEIKGLLEALLRFSGSEKTTLWVDITTDIVHESLIEAIARFQYMEPNLYVSFKNMASHAPAPELPDRLQAAVEKAASRRMMWHPIRCTEVRARPSLDRKNYKAE